MCVLGTITLLDFPMEACGLFTVGLLNGPLQHFNYQAK